MKYMIRKRDAVDSRTAPNDKIHGSQWGELNQSCLRSYFVAVLFALALCLVCGGNAASAQSTAQISGVISDATGAVVPGAQVKATNTDTGIVRATQSSADGSYNLPELAIGPYKLEVKKDGFQSLVQSGIVLEVNTNPTINLGLQVGNISQTVEVRANAAMVESQSNSIGQVIEPEQVVDLPLNSRQPTQLIALAGGTVNTGSNSSGLVGNLDYPSAVSFSVAGSQRNGTNYLLDGAANMDYRTNIGSPMPFPDALQEFKVETSTVPASSGSRPGGVVSAITKSGTNKFHGDVFEFLRNGIMDAAAYNFPAINGTLAKPTYDNLKRNQFGGVIGGPIKKDKIFFFYGIQVTTERQQTAPASRTIPTTAMMAGDFSTFLSPTCQSSQLFLNPTITFQGVAQPLTGIIASGANAGKSNNIINPAWLTTPSAQIDAKIDALYGQPTDQNCGTLLTSGYQHDNEVFQVGRVDWQQSAKNSVFARYFITNYSLLPTLSNPATILSANGVGLADRVQNIALGDTYIATPAIISSFRLDYNRTATQRLGNPKIPNLCTLGLMGTCPTPNIQQSLYLEPGNQGWDYENAYGIGENIAWQLRQHLLQMGFQGEFIQMNGNGTFQENPLPTFTSGSTSYTSNSVADFVTGNPDTFGQGNGQLSRDAQYMPSIYVQDSWKAARNFQVNIGLRWDPYFPQHNKYGEAANFNIANYNNNVASKVFVSAPPGMTFPGDAGFNGKSDTLSHAHDFSPRVGFVWDPRGKGREVIRAGYGLFYDTSLMWNAMHVVLDPPWGNTLSFTPLPVNLAATSAGQGGGEANPYYGQASGNIFPTPFNPPSNYPFNANGGYVFQDQNLKPSNAQQWNLSFQDQISKDWLLSVTYIGSKTSHIWLGNNINPNVVITAGMTAPGIIANNVVAGNPLSGSCTLSYAGQNYTYNTCNSASTAAVNGVSNEAARRALNLSNPAQGYKMSGGITEAYSMGNAAYDGLLASIQHRLNSGFSINGNYTWSHCLDDGEVGQDIVPSFQNPANPKADWANCSFDRRSIFNLSLVGQTPRFKNNWTQRIAGDWNASGIFTASTGAYQSVTDGSDVSLIGQSGVPGSSSLNDRPNQLGNPFTAGTVANNPACTAPAQVKTAAHWFNTCAFATQTKATFGNTARQSLLGSSVWNFDTAVWRTFPLTERYKLDFRGEAFNVFNHPELGLPGVSLSSATTLGRITTTANNMRILQVAVKVHF